MAEWTVIGPTVDPSRPGSDYWWIVDGEQDQIASEIPSAKLARLIAAAPDLLAALEAIFEKPEDGDQDIPPVEAFPSCWEFYGPKAPAVLEQCRAAIAKATGTETTENA